MKKQFTQNQRASLRKSTQKLTENGVVVVYCLANKQSGTGLFSNQRLLLLKSDQKSIRYYSKQPPNLLFSTIAQIPEGKSKIDTEKVKNFKCEAWKGKTTTVKMQWDQNTSWVFTFSNPKMMNQWIAAVQEMRAGTINTDPTFILPVKSPTQNQLKNKPIQNSNIKPPPSNNQPLKTQPAKANQPTKPTQTIQNSKVEPQQKQNTQPPLQNSKNQPQVSQVNQSKKPVQEVKNNTQPNQPNKNPEPVQNQQKNPPENPPLNKNTNPTQQTQQQKKPQNSNISQPPQQQQQQQQPQTQTQTQPQPQTNSNNQQKNPPSNLQPQPNTNQQPSSTNNPTNKPSTSPSPSPYQTKNSYKNAPIQSSQTKQTAQSQPQNEDDAPFILSKQPSNKNLNQPNKIQPQSQSQPQPQPQKQSKDDYETKRDPYYPPRSNEPQNTAPVKKNTNEPLYLKPVPVPIQDQNKINNSRTSNPTPIVESRITNQEPRYQNKALKQKQSRPVVPRDESKSKLSSMKTPAQMSQFYPEDEQNYDSKSRNMNRVQSQQPNFQQNKYNDSRIKSQYKYNPNNQENSRKKQPKVITQHKKWNQLWCSSGRPIEVYEDFIKECQKISTKIIDQLPFIKSDRQYSPLRYQIPYFMYDIEGITYNMHFFGDENLPLESSRDLDEKAPLLFEHQSYTESKRQFYNYNFILGVTGNKTIIKVPLCCYIQYKGILIVCRANIPDGFDKVSPHYHEKQLQQLEQTIRMRFIFNSMSIFAHPQRKYFLITNLEELIPRIPKQIHPPVYFRKQFLVENNFLIDDQSSLYKLNQKLIDENIKQFVNKIENLQLWIINSKDFLQELHRSGISAGCLTQIYQSTNFGFFKKIIVSEMAKSVFCDILRSELNSVYATFPAKQFQDLTVQYVQKIILDCAHVMLNELFSYSSRSENIWRMIVRQVNKKYKVVISKEDIIPGYLLGGIMSYSGIDCDYKIETLNRKQTFFVKQNTIPRDMMIGFYPKVRRYDLDTVSPLIERINQILASEPHPDNFQELVRSLNLKSNDIPSFCHPVKNQIITYMCNFIPLGDHEEFEHIGIYDMLEAEPHTFCSAKISLLAIKWAAKKKNQQLANKIFEIKFQENSFWVSQFNPAISEYYDFFSLFNISTGNYEEGVKLAKSSLVNSIKLTGPNSLPVADKHYQLGNIFFKIGRKQQSLKQYLKTKQILQQNKQTSIPEYGVILLKLSLLYLNFGKISDCVGSSLEALKIFDTNGTNEQEEIETFQILARSYQITRKNGDLASVGALCAQKFNKTQNPKIFERMIKIVMLPKLSTMSHEDAKTLLKLVSKLEQLQSPITYNDAFNYLHSRSFNEVIMKRVFSYLENIFNLYEDVMRKDLLRKHKSLSTQPKSQAAEMLVMLQAIITLTGYNFINGSLRENYY